MGLLYICYISFPPHDPPWFRCLDGTIYLPYGTMVYSAPLPSTTELGKRQGKGRERGRGSI